MSLTGIIILLLIALLLIFLEIFVLPGINVAGILGLLMMIAGIYLSYTQIGTPTAHYVLAATLFLGTLILLFGLRSSTWRKVSLDTSIDSKVNDDVSLNVKVGDHGTTTTRLGPIGTVLINGIAFEAKSANIIDAKTEIEVTEIDGNEIIVKPLK
ncbi:MAG: NfeD family protein [Salinivirgaceae bacterium]|nr:NfeD family protein [Salinivirgaceae bacterium]